MLSKLAIVSIAYLLMIGADFIESVPFYYMTCMMIHLIVMSMCLLSKSTAIKIYGVVNFPPIVLYFPYIYFDFYVTKSLMWSGIVNFANIILIVELLIIMSVIKNGLLSNRRDSNVGNGRNNGFFLNAWIVK